MSDTHGDEGQSGFGLRSVVEGSARLGRKVYRPAWNLAKKVAVQAPGLAGRGVELAGHWITGGSDDARSFEEIFRSELEAVRRLRWRRREDTSDQLAGIRDLRARAPGSGELLRLEREAAEYEADRVRSEEHRPASQGRCATEACRMHLAGLAFSGGGIRSATFQLGVLRGLARMNLLRSFDYLSTVSGGGYIGSWLVAWIQRCGRRAVEEGLERETGSPPPNLPSSPVTFLRAYSNYLTPQKGLFSLDSWMAASTYVRNLVLNLTILALALAAVLMVPRLWVAAAISGVPPWGFDDSLLVQLALALVGLALVVIACNLDPHVADLVRGLSRTGALLAVVVAPLFLAGALLAIWMAASRPEVLTARRVEVVAAGGRMFADGEPGAFVWQALAEGQPLAWTAVGAATYLGAWIFAALLWWGYWTLKAAIDRRWGREHWRREINQWLVAVLMAALAGAVGGLGLWLVGSGLDRVAWSASPGPRFHYWTPMAPDSLLPAGWIESLTWGPPATVGVVVLTGIFHIGLMGWVFPERNRQWWSRLGAWLGLLCGCWLALFAITFYGPPMLEWLRSQSPRVFGSLSLGWVAATAVGVLAGRHPAADGARARKLMQAAARIAPLVFAVGLLALLSLGVYRAVPPAVGLAARALDGGRRAFLSDPAPRDADLAGQVGGSLAWTGSSLDGRLPELGAIFALLLGAVAFLSWRVDINQFSMHLFYRNRLIRPYLGASRRRRPVPFTGFDERDDLELHHLDPRHREGDLYDGPLPILNTSLNLTSGQELAWQDRRANSFVFTPLHYGFQPSLAQAAASRAIREGAYRPTRGANLGRGVSLGTAMAISGAAANPHMGYHSSPALAFLMTVFNVRLGWWMGNPAHPAHRAWTKPSPRFGLAALLSELVGNSSARWKYVNLSDGGFFDNLGIYELVRRRCRLILACDAESDPDLEFGGLGNAIRRCRSDFGIEIEIDVSPIRRQAESGASRWHCAIGTIHYPSAEGAFKGTLVYLKASLTGDEPSDLTHYAKHHPGFPHESTADQWFDEAQFESYRKLGYHVVMSCLASAVMDRGRQPVETDLERIVRSWRQRWHPPLATPEGAFTRHSATLGKLFERLRASPRLRFLDPQIYPEWGALVSGRPSVAPPDWLPRDEDEIREGFYFCNSLMQLMEDVYLDLALEQEHDHPDNRGWMNLFKHWSWSGMFQATWAVSASTYGQRFQSFCERRLDLRQLETVELVELPLGARRGRPATGDSFRRALGGRLQLNFLERRMVADFLDQPRHALDRLLALEVVVHSPFPRRGPGRHDLRFGCGFALLSGSHLAVFRIQDHLRKLGLGRRGLGLLLREHRLEREPLWRVPGRTVRVPGPWRSSFTDWQRCEDLLDSVARERELEMP